MLSKHLGIKKENDSRKEHQGDGFRETTSATTSNAANTAVRGTTVIGEHISIEGDIRGSENLLIEGALKGKIELEKHQVTIGAKGQVAAEIYAASVIVSGRLVGNINASGKVEITKAADFNGEIKAKRISVEDGAYLKAVIELQRNPQKSATLPPPKPIAAVSDTAASKIAPKTDKK